MQKKNGKSPATSTPIIKSGKQFSAKVTGQTVRTLERAGSSESAKIAREIAKK